MGARTHTRRTWTLAIAAPLLLAPEALGTSITASWLAPVDGNWTDPTNWSTDPAYPNNATNTFYTAIVDRVGAPYTITVDSSVTVSTIFLDSPDARLLLVDGTFASAALGTLNFARGQVDVTGATVITRHARLINASRTTLQSGAFDARFTELDDATFIQTGGVHRADDLYLRNASRYELSGGTLHGGAHNHIGLGSASASSTFVMTGGTFYQGGYYTITGGLGAGSFIIDGPSSQYLRNPVGEDTNLVGIGTQSTGHMHVRNGATAELGLTEIGLNYGTGTLVVESGASAGAQRLRVGFGSWNFPPNPANEARGRGTVIVSGAQLNVSGWAQQQPGEPTVEIGTAAFGAGAGGGEGGGAGALGAATLQLNGASLTVQGPMRVNLTAHAIIDASTVTCDALRVAGGSVTFASGSLQAGALHVSAAGQIDLHPGRDKTLHTRSIAVPSGRVDLSDNRMIVDYDAASALADVRDLIAQGYAGGAWTGDGLTSSAAAASAHHALGYAESGDVFAAFPATFGGYEVDDTAVLVTYTRYGDADLDRVVSLADFNRLAAHFGQTGATWSEGDFNYDGIVNLRDFNLLAANFGLTARADGPTPDDWSALAAAVPEPAGAVYFVLVVPLVARFARRRRSCCRTC